MEKLKIDVLGAAEMAELELPPKAPTNLRIRPLQNETVDSNCFKVTFKDTTVHRYEAKFIVLTGGPKDPKNIAEGQKHDVSSERRRMVLNELYRQMLMKNPDIFGKDPLKLLYDCGMTIYSADKLNLGSDTMKKIGLNADDLSPEYRNYLPRKILDLYVEVKFVEDLRVDSSRVAMDEMDADRSSLAFMEMVFNQKIISNPQFHAFKQTCYLKQPSGGGRPQTIQARIIKEGLSKGVRLCGASKERPDLMLQASVKMSAFYPEMPLLDYLKKTYNCRDIRDLEKCFNDRRTVDRIAKDVRKLMLVTTHLKTNRMFICDGLDNKAVSEVYFERENRDGDEAATKKKKVGVVEYMQDRYKVHVQCARMPAVLQKTRDRDGGKVKNFYPIDVLKIMDGQRLPLQKMDGKFQEEMIKVARMDAPTMKQTTERLTKAAFLTASNPYARKFDIGMESTTIRTNADILHPPAILYAQRVAEEPGHDGRLAWRPPLNRHFLKNGECRHWVVVNFNNCARPQMLEDFVYRFIEALGRRGTRIGKPTIQIESRAENVKMLARNEDANYLMVITKDKMDPIHDVLKHFELESQIVTQHLWQNTVYNIVTKNQMVTMDNVVMKANEKLGGTNFTIKTSNKFIQDNRGGHPKINQMFEGEWIADRIFIGVELSHGAPGSQGSATPTVVGFCYNYDQKLSMTGCYFYQSPRETVVKMLDVVIERALKDYKERSEKKTWPTHIVLFRAGVSDGEFRHVTAFEKLAVKRTIQNMVTKVSGFRPIGYTMMICQKNNVRIFPNQAPRPGPNGRITDADKNVRPGTCVSKDIVSPNMEQFILIPHRGIIGTAKPTVYSVVADESPSKKRLEQRELQYLAFALCHLHGGVMGTVSTPAVLYHAGALAKRGSKNLRMDTYGAVDDISTVASSRSGGPLPDQPTGYYEDLSERLKVTLNTKFWC